MYRFTSYMGARGRGVMGLSSHKSNRIINLWGSQIHCPQPLVQSQIMHVSVYLVLFTLKRLQGVKETSSPKELSTSVTKSYAKTYLHNSLPHTCNRVTYHTPPTVTCQHLSYQVTTQKTLS